MHADIFLKSAYIRVYPRPISAWVDFELTEDPKGWRAANVTVIG